MLHFPLVLKNRLNKTESDLFSYCRFSLFLKDPLFQIIQRSQQLSLCLCGVGSNFSPCIDIVLIFFHIQVLHEYWVLTESRIPLKPVLGGVRIVALSISSYLDVATTFLVSVRSC